MTAVAEPARTGSTPRTALVLAGTAVAVSVADLLVAAAAVLGGAEPGYPPITAPVLVPFGLLGLAAASAGWLLVRRRARRPAAVLRVLVPVALVLSWIPDLLAAPMIPGATTPGVVALALMHVVVAAGAVLALRRVAPLRA